MSSTNEFDHLPNELYLFIFDYLNPLDIIYSFSNLNKRLNIILNKYIKKKIEFIDLTKLNPNVFKFFSQEKYFNNEIISIKLTDNQLKSLSFSLNNKLNKISLYLENDYYIYSKDQFIFQYIQYLIIENHSLTWQKPFIICQNLKEIQIHIKSHSDLIELLNFLPNVEKVHVTIDYDVKR